VSVSQHAQICTQDGGPSTEYSLRLFLSAQSSVYISQKAAPDSGIQQRGPLWRDCHHTLLRLRRAGLCGAGRASSGTLAYSSVHKKPPDPLSRDIRLARVLCLLGSPPATAESVDPGSATCQEKCGALPASENGG
jgi:hypothetical protein